jgi:hypothetical protein
MREEIRFFDNFTVIEEKLNSLAKKKKWLEMQKVLEDLSHVAGLIEKTEERRNLLYLSCKDRFQLNEEDSFQSFLSKVPSDQRSILFELHRQIKKKLLKIKSLSSGLIYYFACMQDSIAQVLDEIFPHRKGKFYSRQGEARESNDHAVVINQQL